MDTAHYKDLLQNKQQELTNRIQRQETEARDDTDRATPEAMERMVNLEDQDIMLQQAAADSRQLEEVQAALQRIENGSFGMCTACGEQIEPKRLEAVPWTLFCLEDQERQDQETGNTANNLTL